MMKRMPRYTYRCDECGEAFEVNHSMSLKLEDCNLCQSLGSLVRVPSSTFITTNTTSTKDNKKVGDVVKEHIEESKKELKSEQQKLKDVEYNQ
jgi:putative FmdB family regulatory protein